MDKSQEASNIASYPNVPAPATVYNNTQPAPYYPQQPPSYHGYAQNTQPQATYNQGGVVQVQTAPVIVQQTEPRPSMTGYIVLSCFVFWCCNCLFGAIAFFIAISASSATTAGDARRQGKTSMWVSIAGIIISVLVAVILIILYFTGVAFVYETTSYTCYNNQCYYN